MKKLSLRALFLSFILLFSATAFADPVKDDSNPPPPPPPAEDSLKPDVRPEPVDDEKPGAPGQQSRGIWDG